MSDLEGTHPYRQVSIWLTGRPQRPHFLGVLQSVLQYQCGRATHYPCTAHSFNHFQIILTLSSFFPPSLLLSLEGTFRHLLKFSFFNFSLDCQEKFVG
jgi:hypothetical protein